MDYNNNNFRLSVCACVLSNTNEKVFVKGLYAVCFCFENLCSICICIWEKILCNFDFGVDDQ